MNFVVPLCDHQNEETLKNALQNNLEKWKKKDEQFMKFKKEAEEKLLTYVIFHKITYSINYQLLHF